MGRWALLGVMGTLRREDGVDTLTESESEFPLAPTTFPLPLEASLLSLAGLSELLAVPLRCNRTPGNT